MCWDRLIELDAETPARHPVRRDAEPVRSTDPASATPAPTEPTAVPAPDELALAA